VRIPDSALVAEAARVVAKCKVLERSAGIVHHARAGSQPIELVLLTAAAHRLVLRAAVFGGDARDIAAAAEAEAAAAALEATWLAGKTTPAPVAPVAEMPEPGPVGRPRIGSLVHRWDERNGKCHPAFVLEVHGGTPANVAVTAESPYLKLVDAGGDRSRPENARWISKPLKDLQPGMRPIIVSWHRGTPAECPGWSK
jgi:hypothetical protein